MPGIWYPIAQICAQLGSTSGLGSGVGWPKSSVLAGGPPGVQVPGAHRGQGHRQLGGQRGGNLDLAAGRDQAHRQRRAEAVGGELADMTGAVVDLDPGAGGVLHIVAGGVLGHPQRLDQDLCTTNVIGNQAH
jgi:hypothetical protein